MSEFHREPEKESAWLRLTDGEYYHRVRQIMLSYGMGEGDVEAILGNIWGAGWDQHTSTTEKP